MIDKDIETINLGNKADLLLQNFGGYIDQSVDEIFQKMITLYRSDISEPPESFKMLVAEASAIKRIKEKMVKDIKKGNSRKEIVYGSQ